MNLVVAGQLALASSSHQTVLLTCFAGAPVVVLAATNRPDALDGGLRRPGRFDREVEVGAPSPAERRDMLEKLLQHMSHDLTPGQVREAAV